MLRILKKLEKSIVFILKMLLYVWLIASFFLIMGIENWPLLNISRTAGVTLLMFVVVCGAMSMVYGTYDIGQRKSKPIISSLALATAVTDIITAFQIMIMNASAANGFKFTMINIGLLAATFIVQIIGIILFTYGGNWIYFMINPPQRCCIVTSNERSFVEIEKAINHFKKQFQIDYVRNYQSKDLLKIMIKCDTVFIYDVPVKERTEIIEFCYRHMINIYFNPEIPDIVEINSKNVILDDISLILAPVKELSFEQKFLKRFMDLMISSIAIIILSPVILICAVGIKICDGGKIIFKQERATKDGHIFSVYKFRTMRENAEIYSATVDDDRITPIGKIMRKYRLDEIPQLFNIFKGEMSIVGPRPEMLKNVYMYTKEMPEFQYRLRVKAGLTGYAQIAGKYNTSPKYKLILDLMYIEKYSIMKDIKLILQTLIVFFKPESTEGFSKNMTYNIETYAKRMNIDLSIEDNMKND